MLLEDKEEEITESTFNNIFKHLISLYKDLIPTMGYNIANLCILLVSVYYSG